MSNLLSSDVWYEILERIEDPSPRLFLTLARANRCFREVFLSDMAWAYLDVYNVRDSHGPDMCYIYKDYYLRGIAGHFMNYLNKQDTGLRQYYLLRVPPNIDLSERHTERGDLYLQLQYLADGEPIDYPYHSRDFNARVWDTWSKHLHGEHSLVNYLGANFERSDPEYTRHLRINIAYESQRKTMYDLEQQYSKSQPTERYRFDHKAYLETVALKIPHDNYFDSEKSFMLEAVELWGPFYYRTSGRLRSDWDIIHAAIDADSRVWRHIPKPCLRKDEDLCIKIVKQHPDLLDEYELDAEYETDDMESEPSYITRNVVLAAVSEFGLALAYAHDEMRNDKEPVLTALKNNSATLRAKLFDSIRSNWIFYNDMERHGERMCVLFYASKFLKNDRDVVLAALASDPNSLSYASVELQNDHEIVMTAVKHSGFVFTDLPEKFQNDREIVLQAVKANGDNLQYAPDNLKNDRGIVMAAVEGKGDALRHAPLELQDDEDVALAALANRSSPLSRMLLVGKFASPYWFDSGPSLEEQTYYPPYFNKNTIPVGYTPWARSKNIVRTVVTLYGGHYLQLASPDLRDDADIVEAALDNDPEALIHASKRLKRGLYVTSDRQIDFLYGDPSKSKLIERI